MSAPWQEDEGFGQLCDLVASDQLVCLTGAGISTTLRRRSDPSRFLPGWLTLLRELRKELRRFLNAAERGDCDQLLGDGARSADLILAAKLLRGSAPAQQRRFDDYFRNAITPAQDETSRLHRGIALLKPRGIVTFNYDDGHEVAERSNWVHLTPSDEAGIVKLIESRFSNRFLLKAHGSIDDGALILTADDYRDLLAKSPAYRAFVQLLFSKFHFLIVGFGMDDPDFDRFMASVAETYGSPLHEHVLLLPRWEMGRREIVNRHRYGIQVLCFDEYEEIPKILLDARRCPGPKLKRILDQCLSRNRSTRRVAHRALRRLGPSGKELAGRVLKEQIEKSTDEPFRLSELAYSLGVLDPVRHKNVLISIINNADNAAPIARALTQLRPALRPSDLPLLRRWRKRFRNGTLSGVNPRRIETYLEYLIVFVPAAHRSGV